ncbi:SulP family inorganic anion transporter [Neptuniibacter marinus]|uniref:SulP family inorganic anion transporter n=1 Tax=Neptuniibacter marinus TaxID=1806670 RepID=UPI00082F3114|nr:SulP family inorganic anion transporter [Neptuniibacter marinus]
MQFWAELFPILGWLKNYQRQTFISDLIASIIVSILLIPQSMAYAILAGLPLGYGLNASILPLLIYSLLGNSRSLAVGPVAIASLMVNTSVSQIAPQGGVEYLNAEINLSNLIFPKT